MTRFRPFICAVFVTIFAAGGAAAAQLALTVADASIVNEPVVGGPAVNITLAADSAKTFEDFTAAHVGDQLDVIVDGTTVMSLTLLDPIRGGTLQISGAFDRAEWKKIAARLKSGQSRLEVGAASP